MSSIPLSETEQSAPPLPYVEAVPDTQGATPLSRPSTFALEPSRTDRLDATQERIVSSPSSSPNERHDADDDAPESSAFIDCVSAGATCSQYTPQRSVGEQILIDLMNSAPPVQTEANAQRAAQSPAVRSALVSPALTGGSPQVPAEFSPSSHAATPATPDDHLPSCARQAASEDLAADVPEKVRATEQDSATGTSNVDSSAITSGKGVLRSLYLDQKRRQQRQRLHAFAHLVHEDSDDSDDSQPHSRRSGSDPHSVESLGEQADNNSRPRSPRSSTSTTPSTRQRRTESAGWAISQQRALDQLRAELESTSQTPSRHGGGRLTPHASHDMPAPAANSDHQRAPVQANSEAKLPVGPVVTRQIPAPSPPKEHTMLTVRPNLSTISNISPLRNEVPSVLADLYGQSPYSQVTGDVAELSPFHEDDRDEAMRALSPPRRDASLEPGTADQLVQEDDDEETRLKWMPKEGKTYTTSRRTSPARSPPPTGESRVSPIQIPARQNVSADAGGYAAVKRQHSTHKTNTTAASGHHVPSMNVEARERKMRKLKAEAEAKEMADCTFHPAISPGTRAMVEMSRLMEASVAAAETRVEDDVSGAPAALTEPVFDRLYPDTLVAAASQKRQMESEMEARRLAREELLSLRKRCRAPFKVETPEASFDVFLSNVLGLDCYEPGAIVSSSYKSPMAVALIEEKAARRRLAERRRTELRDDVEDSQEFRIALFDEFLLRQNAHYFNKARTIQQLERHLTPSFTPGTTTTSTNIVKRLVERSMMDETLDPAEKVQLKQRHARGEPIASTLVRKHKSKYEDPCTFHPVISQYASGIHPSNASGASSPLPGSPTSAETKKALSSQAARKRGEVPRYMTLYQEHKRIASTREKMQAKAAKDEVAGCTFHPTNLNRKRNANVTSFVEEPSYSQHEAQMRERQQKREALRAEQTVLEEERENRECTFRPKVTKPPAYIARMAKGFGVIRTQDTEF